MTRINSQRWLTRNEGGRPVTTTPDLIATTRATWTDSYVLTASGTGINVGPELAVGSHVDYFSLVSPVEDIDRMASLIFFALVPGPPASFDEALAGQRLWPTGRNYRSRGELIQLPADNDFDHIRLDAAVVDIAKFLICGHDTQVTHTGSATWRIRFRTP